MKNPYYVIETFYSRGAMDYGDWHKESTHSTLKAALLKKAKMLALKEEDYSGKMVRAWTASKIRVIEYSRKVVR